jgi:hypothetical protein
MSEVLVNERPIPLESGQKTWADVLTAVDARAAIEGHVVTAVRFGGVDQPSFRTSSLQALAIPEAGRIEVETVPRERLLRTTLGAAGLSLPEIAAGASHVASAFRRGDLGSAHEQLGTLLATVRTLVDLTLASAAAAGTDLHDLPCGAHTAAEILGATGLALDGLAQHQVVEDWVALADELEYALAPSLLAWSVVFEAMQERSAA